MTTRSAVGQRGQAMVEYAVITAALAAALFLPVFPRPDGGGSASLLMLFVEVFDIYMNSFHSVIALPIP